MLKSDVSTYASLATFESIDQLNEATRKHRNSHALTPTENAVLDVLAQYSCKYPGVSFLTKNNIAELVDKSRRTIIRVCQRLEALGIVKQYDMKRVQGDRRQTSNAIVIQAVEVTSDKLKETPVTPAMSHHKTLTPLKHKDTYKDTAIPAQALRNSLPSKIYETMQPYFNADQIYEYYGVLLRAKKSIASDVLIEDHADLFSGVFLNAVRLLKRGKVRNLSKYLYAAWQASTAVAKRRQAQSVPVWLC